MFFESRSGVIKQCFFQLMSGECHKSYEAPGVKFTLSVTHAWQGKNISINGEYSTDQGLCTANTLMMIFNKFANETASLHNLLNIDCSAAHVALGVIDQYLDGQSEKTSFLYDGCLRVRYNGYRKVSYGNERLTSTSIDTHIDGSSSMGKRVANAVLKHLSFLPLITDVNRLEFTLPDPREAKILPVHRENRHLLIASATI